MMKRIILISLVMFSAGCTLFVDPEKNTVDVESRGEFLDEVAWQLETSGKIIASPVYENGKIILITDSEVLCIHAQSGVVLWARAILVDPGLSYAPIVNGQYIAVPAKDARIVVLELETGELLWETEIVRAGSTGMLIPRLEGFDVIDEKLVISRFDYGIQVFNLRTGKELWSRYVTGRENSYFALHKASLIYGKADRLISLNLVTGTEEWSIDLDDFYLGPMGLDRNREIIYITNQRSAKVSAISIPNREVLWETDLGTIGAYEIMCLSNPDDFLFISANEIIRLDSVTGETVTRTGNLGTLECPVFGQLDFFVVRNTSTSLYLIDYINLTVLKTMDLQSNTPMKSDPDRSPVFAGDLLVVPFSDHLLRAYQIIVTTP